MPLGELLWTAATLAEQSGSLQIIDEEEQEAIALIRERRAKRAAEAAKKQEDGNG